MACARQSPTEYLRNTFAKLVTHIQNPPLIVDNLYQQTVFNDHEVDALKAERTEFDKARCILDWVTKKGEEASYILLKILDVTKKRTLHPDLHPWISCFPFRVEDEETSFSFGTNPCQNYQTALKKKAKRILKDQRERYGKYRDDKAQRNFHFIPVVLERHSVMKTPQSKIKWKNKKCKKLRPKKLRAYIPTEQQALSPEDLLRCQEKNILLIGKPGIGKTTVVQETLHLWAEKDNRKLDYMFYFDESVLSGSSNDDLESILFKVYLKPMEKDRKDVFQDIEENSENVVIVFDGVTCVQEHSVLKKIMDHELLPEAKIIITCRSEEEDEPLFNWPTLKVYVEGFSEESIRTYYQKMLGHDPVLLDVVLKNQELFSLSHVPMYAFMVVTFIPFKNDTDFNHPHTVTEMYIHIFRLAVKKHGKKTVQQIDKYLRENKDQVQLLMEKAFKATMQKTLILPDISSNEEDICHAFLKMITATDSLSSAMTCCVFLHNTMQEFFSALWLLGHPDEIEKVLQRCQTEENKHMKHVLPFLCGLLGEHNIKLIKCLFPEDQIKKTSDWFIEKFLETFLQPQSESEEFDLLYVCQCLYELQSPEACLKFLEKMDHQLEPEEDLDPHQCCALAYVITQSSEKEVYLNLEDCNMTDAGMDMMLSCSPKIRLKIWKEPLKQITFFREFFHKASQCSCSNNNPGLCDFLLDLCSHVKNYETQTGRSFLPALQSVFQLPDVWIIDLSERKTSVLLEVLKLQTEKKPVELRGWSEEEKSFLQCLSYISQLRFRFYHDEEMKKSAVNLLLNLSVAAVENDTVTGTRFSTLLSSVCSYRTFPFDYYDPDYQSDFLLDLCSHVKDYETQTGRSFLPALQSVFQLPDVWIIDLSERKTSVLLEVLKLQTEKKPVELRGWSEEESEEKSFLQCLSYISQLRFRFYDLKSAVNLLLNLSVAAVENDTVTGTRFSTLLSSVCSYRTFPFDEEGDDYDPDGQCDFLLDLCSHVKNYETQTGRSFLPALQSVFQSPDVWIIDLSERKTSDLLEVLKLQTEKKPVELSGCSEEESEVKSFLQCLSYISQLSCSEWCLLTLVKVVQLRENPELVTSLLEVLGSSVSLEGSLPSKSCRSVGRVLRFSSDRLNLSLKPKAISLRGTRLLFRHITHIHTLRLSGYMVLRIVQVLRSMRVQTPVTVNELTLDLNGERLSERKWSRVLSSLAIFLRLWTVQCLNLTECKMASVSLCVLLCLQGPVILRPPKESLQKLVECVYEAQEEELTQHFLQKVGGDLTSCSLSWEELHYFLQHRIQQITVNFRKSNIQCNIREILPFLNRIQFKRMSSVFMLSVITEIYESGSVECVSSLLSSVQNCLTLQSRDLDSVHCAALRFTLQHCTVVSLNLLWTSIPEEELESIVPLFRHVSHIRVDRLLLLKMLRCCSVSDVQQEFSSVLLSVLQHKLDFSCRSALDLTANTHSETLHLTTEDCRVMTTVIQRAHTHTQLILQDCEMNTAGMDQLFPVLHAVKLCCDKSLLLQFLAHVSPEEAESLSRALGDEVDLSQTPLEPQVCRGLALILEYSEGLTELDLSQCRLTDPSLDLLLPNLHKAQSIDFSGNSISDTGAQRIYSIVCRNSDIKTVRLFNNRIESRKLFLTDQRFEIW
ncbi:hypothetical protein PO909_000636 [Leuciscus waleckii]